MTKLYVILGSHAARAGILMLEHKRISYDLVTLPTGFHAPILRVLGFSGQTVPALRYDGRRVQTNAAIAEFLDEVQPEPRLLPEDPAKRSEVENAERWGENELQMIGRRLIFARCLFGPEGQTLGSEGRLGTILSRSDRHRRRIARTAGRHRFNVTRETERELLAELPAMLDRVDAWIDAGVLNGPELNAADFVIAADLALLTYRPDVREQIEARPALALVDRVLPEPAG